ncbi:MAG: DNA polymerase III subunit gamma/tau [Geminicoccaceae bacterium]|nr:MAG: DNA polymerase III subunit gamma/tau [Geminicoccaceae bacterium]
MLTTAAKPYRVLARAYRPSRLADLIGQDALVRTLGHAFGSGRIAQAYLLTGIRGTGKTTTARIIAKCLNCIGPDGEGGVTAEPCGVCEHCTAIAEDRHIDVIEMDAATQTGIGDIREIVDNVRYAPASGRYKVYIIDEVHMLSQQAFNGLLKTLEEPPPHAKFVFATTEVRRIPVTVLSRCQRFDLRRIDQEVLAAHLLKVATAEGAEIEPLALDLIARVGGGSVRDALSLLDQAITLADGTVRLDQVQAMLGVVDKGRVVELLGHVVEGRAGEALALFGAMMAEGGDPRAVVEDLLGLCHRLTRDKLDPNLRDPDLEVLAQRVGLAPLARAWQVLLKGLEEIGRAPDAIAAAEMLLVRLACMGDLPSPAELMRRLEGGLPAINPGPATAPAQTPSPAPSAQIAPPPARPTPAEPAPPETAPAVLPAMPQDLPAIVRALRVGGEPLLAAMVHHNARPASIEPGRLRLNWLPGTPAEASSRLAQALQRLTGRRWGVDRAPSEAPTLAELDAAHRQKRMVEVRDLPHVRHILEAVPGATIVGVETAGADSETQASTLQEGIGTP